ncbi:MAG: sulfurtransferase TusA family protein [Rhodovibrionaceae bacterium]
MSDDQLLDAKGLKCPLPVLKAGKAIKAMDPGAVLIVEATDPSAPEDFKNFCETTGHELIDLEEAEGVYRFTLKKV